MRSIVFYSLCDCNKGRKKKNVRRFEFTSMDISLHPSRERVIEGNLILNARSLTRDPIRTFSAEKKDHASRANYTVGFSSFYIDASRKLNFGIALMDRIYWLSIRKENGFAQRRRRRASRELDTTDDWPVDTTTFYASSLSYVFFFSSRKRAIAVKCLRRDGSLTIPYASCCPRAKELTTYNVTFPRS